MSRPLWLSRLRWLVSATTTVADTPARPATPEQSTHVRVMTSGERPPITATVAGEMHAAGVFMAGDGPRPGLCRTFRQHELDAKAGRCFDCWIPMPITAAALAEAERPDLSAQAV